MEAHHGALRPCPHRVKCVDSVCSPHLKATQVRAEEPEKRALGGTVDDRSIFARTGITAARLDS